MEFDRLLLETESVLLGETANWFSRRSNTSTSDASLSISTSIVPDDPATSGDGAEMSKESIIDVRQPTCQSHQNTTQQ